MAATVEMDARLAQLKLAYVATLPELLAEFDAGVARLRNGVEEARDGLRAIAHRLAGTGALYGVTALTLWGKQTERIARDGAPSAATIELIEAAADRLREIVRSVR